MQQQGIKRQDPEDASLISPHHLMEHENEWSARKNSVGSFEGIDPRRAIRYIIKDFVAQDIAWKCLHGIAGKHNFLIISIIKSIEKERNNTLYLRAKELDYWNRHCIQTEKKEKIWTWTTQVNKRIQVRKLNHKPDHTHQIRFKHFEWQCQNGHSWLMEELKKTLHLGKQPLSKLDTNTHLK